MLKRRDNISDITLGPSRLVGYSKGFELCSAVNRESLIVLDKGVKLSELYFKINLGATWKTGG